MIYIPQYTGYTVYSVHRIQKINRIYYTHDIGYTGY